VSTVQAHEARTSREPVGRQASVTVGKAACAGPVASERRVVVDEERCASMPLWSTWSEFEVDSSRYRPSQ
jgi:hypothetical protein